MLPAAALFTSLALLVCVLHLDVLLEVAVFKGYVYVPLDTVKVFQSSGTNSESPLVECVKVQVTSEPH